MSAEQHLLDKVRAQRVQLLAIGGSAGSIDVLLRLCPALPASCPLAVVAVVHLPPIRESLLPQLLAPRCALPVAEAEPWMGILPGRIYLAPPGYHLGVESDHTFSLGADEPVHFARPSIDAFFEAVADVYGARALGVLLTGANSDGASGLRAIARAGGLTLVQDPASAQRPEMPRAALALMKPTAILSVDGIARVFTSLASSTWTRQ
jgi:two-component system, chemotaxis family, protein-glutamate methylesterase/glutaminase